MKHKLDTSTICEKKIVEIICTDGFDQKRFNRIGEALMRRIANRERKARKKTQEEIMDLHRRSGKFGFSDKF